MKRRPPTKIRDAGVAAAEDAVWMKLPIPAELAKTLRDRAETASRLFTLVSELVDAAAGAAKDVQGDVKAIKRATSRRKRD